MPIDASGVHIRTRFCNIFGGENDGGAKRVLGGIGPQTPARQWFCENEYVGRFRMECEHGHRGDIMRLCWKHKIEFGNSVTFCPRCNANESTGHKCRLKISEIY